MKVDVLVIGAGPAGSAAALGALTQDPSLRVVLLDRRNFPRDKSCGDGIAPHVVTALAEVGASIPLDWRRGSVERGDLDRFLFEPDDLVVVVGQDGLVANVAKYLDGQPVLGLNPAPDLYDGVLVRVPLGRFATPGEVADVIVFLCSARASTVTGAAWSADGGAVAIII